MRNPIGEGVSTPRSVAASGKAMPRVRGLALPQIIVIVLGLALLAVAAWWFLGSGGTTVTSTATAPTQAAAPGENSAPNAEPASADLSVDQLYKEARAAMSENRMVTPAGKNALEYYLRIVAKQPDDNGAKDALRELFPFATAGVEDQINQGNFDEANRIMALLATADPSNYTLTILRSKLDLKKKQADRDLAQKAAQEAAAAAAATRTAQGGTAPGASEVPFPSRRVHAHGEGGKTSLRFAERPQWHGAHAWHAIVRSQSRRDAASARFSRETFTASAVLAPKRQARNRRFPWRSR